MSFILKKKIFVPITTTTTTLPPTTTTTTTLPPTTTTSTTLSPTTTSTTLSPTTTTTLPITTTTTTLPITTTTTTLSPTTTTSTTLSPTTTTSTTLSPTTTTSTTLSPTTTTSTTLSPTTTTTLPITTTTTTLPITTTTTTAGPAPTTKFDATKNVPAGVITSDDKYLLGGNFNTYDSETASKIIKLDNNGLVDQTFKHDIGFNASDVVNSIAKTADGGYLVIGTISEYSGMTGLNGIIKLDANGYYDSSFPIDGVAGGNINVVYGTTDGGFLLGGGFTTYSGISANGIIKILSTGYKDNSFDYGTGFESSYLIGYFTEVSDGNYMVGGTFDEYNGSTSRRGLIKLLNTGAHDTSFDIGIFNAGSGVIEFVPDEDYIAYGYWTYYQDQFDAEYAIKFTKLGVDTSNYKPNQGVVRGIIDNIDGDAVLFGNFTTFSGVSSSDLIKFDKNDIYDTNLDTGTGVSGNANILLQNAAGNYIIAGNFNSYKSTNGNGIFEITRTGDIVW